MPLNSTKRGSLNYKVGNLVAAPETIIAHGCNAQGVMGSGVAKVIKEKFPLAYRAYTYAYEKRGLKLGEVVFCVNNDKTIANCITQQNFGRDGKQYCDYDAIRQCFQKIAFHYAPLKFKPSIALPKIGAGLGGGDWNVISKIIGEELTAHDVTIYVLDESEIPA